MDVYTGDKRHAGTDANVFINLHGDMGDTGDRDLNKSKNNINKFERNQVSESTAFGSCCGNFLFVTETFIFEFPSENQEKSQKIQNFDFLNFHG